jgi:hypothetical protein
MSAARGLLRRGLARLREIVVGRLGGAADGPEATPIELAEMARRVAALDANRSMAGGFRFQLELLLIGVVQTVPIGPANEGEGRGRPLRELGCKRLGRVEQLVVVMDLIDESPVKRLLRRYALGEDHELLGPRHADDTREQPGRASVRNQTDARKGELEKRAARPGCFPGSSAWRGPRSS